MKSKRIVTYFVIKFLFFISLATWVLLPVVSAFNWSLAGPVLVSFIILGVSSKIKTYESAVFLLGGLVWAGSLFSLGAGINFHGSLYLAGLISACSAVLAILSQDKLVENYYYEFFPEEMPKPAPVSQPVIVSERPAPVPIQDPSIGAILAFALYKFPPLKGQVQSSVVTCETKVEEIISETPKPIVRRDRSTRKREDYDQITSDSYNGYNYKSSNVSVPSYTVPETYSRPDNSSKIRSLEARRSSLVYHTNGSRSDWAPSAIQDIDDEIRKLRDN